MNCIHIVPDGPSLEDCEFIEEFKMGDNMISFFEGKGRFFFSDDGWRNYGPFASHKDALIGLAKMYFDRCKNYEKAYSEIDDIIRKM